MKLLRRRAAWCATVLLAGAVAATAPASAQRPCDDRCPFSSAYNTISLAFHPSHSETDVLLGAGRAWLTTPEGRWSARADALAGMSFYTSLARNFGYLLGVQGAAAWTLTGDYLTIGETFVEAYLTAGAGGYYAWRMEETPDERGLVPVARVGAGLRFQERDPRGRAVLLELVHEERIGTWAPIVMLRVSLAFAVGR
jgi:hypothetical protein